MHKDQNSSVYYFRIGFFCFVFNDTSTPGCYIVSQSCIRISEIKSINQYSQEIILLLRLTEFMIYYSQYNCKMI